MPSIVRSSSRVLRSARAPYDDEIYVMQRYAEHATRCVHCAYPCAVVDEKRSICSRGHRHVSKLLKYIYNKRGKAYSVTDLENGKTTQIAIPPEYDVINDLMRALHKGLEIQAPQPSPPSTPTKTLPRQNTFDSFDSSLPFHLPPRPDSPPVSESVISAEHERPRKKRNRDSDPFQRSPPSREGAFRKHKKTSKELDVQYQDTQQMKKETKTSPRLRTPDSWLS